MEDRGQKICVKIHSVFLEVVVQNLRKSRDDLHHNIRTLGFLSYRIRAVTEGFSMFKMVFRNLICTWYLRHSRIGLRKRILKAKTVAMGTPLLIGAPCSRWHHIHNHVCASCTPDTKNLTCIILFTPHKNYSFKFIYCEREGK